MKNRKSVLLALVLTFFLGPFGMVYSTVVGAVVMLVLYVALGFRRSAGRLRGCTQSR